MVLIDAIYINRTGGKVLLEYLIESILDTGCNDFFVLLDSRLESPILQTLRPNQMRVLDASEPNRRQFYRDSVASFNSVLCFASIPPPLKIEGCKVYVFFQNALLLSTNDTGYKLKARLSFWLKKKYIQFNSYSNYQWIVQTNDMKRRLQEYLSLRESEINVIPIFKLKSFEVRNVNRFAPQFHFLYVADGAYHKNHKRLLDAWKYLNTNFNPDMVLHLTIPEEFPKLLVTIEEYKKNGCKIVNHGHCDHEELSRLYDSCKYLIFPSLLESFGLPLIEAGSAGCEVVSSDLPYVYDVVKPSRVFDPYSVESIIEAVVDVVDQNFVGNTEVVVRDQISYLIALIK
jgi:glycosyltransferase involved in cell wall biosynthesis